MKKKNPRKHGYIVVTYDGNIYCTHFTHHYTKIDAIKRIQEMIDDREYSNHICLYKIEKIEWEKKSIVRIKKEIQK